VLPAEDPHVFGVTMMSIGFNVATIQFLAMHGLDMMTSLFLIPLSQFDMMIKNINQPATFPAPVPGIPGVKFPYAVVMALKSLCAWCDYCHSPKQTLNPTVEPNLDLTVWTVHLDALICWVKLKDGKPFDGVPKSLSFKELKTWDELFHTALCHVQSVITSVPYLYLVWLHQLVDPLYFTLVYCSIDDDLMNMASYWINNGILYDRLQQLIISGEGFPFMQQCDW
jgi:hypothetical protein